MKKCQDYHQYFIVTILPIVNNKRYSKGISSSDDGNVRDRQEIMHQRQEKTHVFVQEINPYEDYTVKGVKLSDYREKVQEPIKKAQELGLKVSLPDSLPVGGDKFFDDMRAMKGDMHVIKGVALDEEVLLVEKWKGASKIQRRVGDVMEFDPYEGKVSLSSKDDLEEILEYLVEEGII